MAEGAQVAWHNTRWSPSPHHESARSAALSVAVIDAVPAADVTVREALATVDLLIITTRDGRNLRAALDLETDVAYVSAADLLFTPSEMRQCLTLAGVPDSATTLVHEVSGGHPLATRAIIAAAARKDASWANVTATTASAWAAEGIHTALTAHRKELSDLIPDTEALGALLISERPSVSLAKTLLGPDDAERVLGHAGAAGLISIDESNGDAVIVLPFVEAILRRLKPGDDATHRALLQRMLAWSREHGDAVESLAAAAKLRDIEAMADGVLARAGVELIERADRTVELLGRFSTGELSRRPVLCLVMALARSTQAGGRVDGRAWLRITIDAGERSTNGSSAISFEGEAASLVARRMLGDTSAAVEGARELAARAIDAAGQHALPPHLGAAYLQQAATTMFVIGHLDEAAEFLTAGVTTAGVIRGDEMRTDLAALHALRGEVRRARDDLNEATVDDAEPERLLQQTHVTRTAAQVLILTENGEPAEALALLANESPRIARSELWPLCAEALLLAEAARFPGKVPGMTTIEKWEKGALVAPPPYWRARLASGRALVALGAGNRHLAEDLTEEARSIHHQPAVALTQARLLVSMGRPHEALAALDASGVPTDPRTLLGRALLTAVAYHAVGDATSCTQATSEAARTSLAYGATTPWLLLGASERDTLLKEATQLPTRERDALLRAQRLFPLGESAGQRPTVTLSRTEREVVRLLATGAELKEIARHRHVSLNTIRTQTRSIYRKFGVRSRHEAVVRASELGLVRGAP
ncbi:helix-turn-helix transcriptional regulator [Demequina sediminicola]|uniref:helix-turn-helix transcriptional regulator n=1 Tax=Demequina sediminicola TaxID=1095026 RepID=UPI000780D58C|nr:LuxR C-terminal-related transcriptional regulator [Demequina sediminicola]